MIKQYKIFLLCVCVYFLPIDSSVFADTNAITKSPQILRHIVKIKIDHNKKILFGDCQIIFSDLKTKKDIPIIFSMLDGEIEKIYINKQETKNYIYRDYFGLSRKQSQQYNLKELTISVPAKVASEDSFTIRVIYKDPRFYATATNPEDNKPFSLGQITTTNAFSSHINYYPYISYAGKEGDIYISSNLSNAIAITSGKLKSIYKEADGYTTYHYHSKYTSGILAYPFAIAPYEKLEAKASDGKTKLQIFFLPQDRKFALEKMSTIQQIFSIYLDLFGSYPFPKLAIVETDLQEGNIGLAAQSVVMLSKKVWFAAPINFKDKTLANNSLYVLADEINHQWNAYKVHTPNFLAEGISRYVDSLYGEILGGEKILIQHMKQTAAGYFYLIEKQKIPDKPIVDPTVYPALYFIKGAMALHMLRGMYGYEKFKKALRTYFSKYQGKTTSLKDFQSAFEKANKTDLNWFFHQWYKTAGWPKLMIKWGFQPIGENKYLINVNIVQKQKNYFLLKRFPVHVNYKDKTKDIVYIDIQNIAKQDIQVKVKQKPVDLLFDPDGWVLKTIDVSKK